MVRRLVVGWGKRGKQLLRLILGRSGRKQKINNINSKTYGVVTFGILHEEKAKAEITEGNQRTIDEQKTKLLDLKNVHQTEKIIKREEDGKRIKRRKEAGKIQEKRKKKDTYENSEEKNKKNKQVPNTKSEHQSKRPQNNEIQHNAKTRQQKTQPEKR